MDPPTLEAGGEELDKECIHDETKCVKCGLTFNNEVKKRNTTVATVRRRRLSSSFGTFMKKVDEREKDFDEKEKEEEEEEEEISTSTGYSYLVKYSVNGEFKGQTRLSFDLLDQHSWQRSLNDSSFIDVFDEDERERRNVKDVHDVIEQTDHSLEIVEEDHLKQNTESCLNKNNFKEDICSSDVTSTIENKRSFSIKKQASLNEYRIRTYKTSTKIQKKLSLFTDGSTESPESGPASKQSSIDGDGSTQAGTTFSSFPNAKRKKIQQQLLDEMFKHAEQKYGRKKPHRSGFGGKRSPMEDYELYLRSLNITVKSANDKLAAITKQKRDIEAKLAEAEKEHNFHKTKFSKAEEEKQNAIKEKRNPVLPKDFIPPQIVKSRGKAANLGALVMKASSQMEIWEDKFNAKRTKKNADTPEWIAKQKKSDKTSALLNAGRNKLKEKKPESKFPTTTLNKIAGNRTTSKVEHEESNSKNGETEETQNKNVTRSPEESEEEEEETTFRRRRNRIPRSDDEDFDI